MWKCSLAGSWTALWTGWSWSPSSRWMSPGTSSIDRDHFHFLEMQSVNSICNWTSTRPRSPLCWKSLSQRTGHYHIWTNVSQPPITADCGGDHLTTVCRWAWCWRACSRGGVRGVTAVAMLPMSGRYPPARPGQHITNTTLHNTLLKQSYMRLQLLWTLTWPCISLLVE